MRVGIIGAGWAGSSHAAAYARLPGVAVTALWSRTRARAAELAARLPEPAPRVYDRWEELVERADVDAISLAAPPVLRAEPVRAILERGRHLLVEKPFAITLEEARAMARLAEQAETVTAVCLNWRYAPACLTARRALREGQIGRLRDIRTEWRLRTVTLPQGFLEQKTWFMRSDWGGGALREIGSHEFDRVRFLTGWEFRSLVGRLVPWSSPDYPEMTGEGAYHLLAEMSDEGLGAFRFTMTAGQSEWHTVLCGTEGTLTVANDHVVRQRAEDRQPVSLDIAAADAAAAGIPLIEHTWNRLIADFVTAVRHADRSRASTPYLPSFHDGIRVQEVIAAAEAAEAQRRWVTIGEEADH